MHAHASAPHDWSGIWTGKKVYSKYGSVAHGHKAGDMSFEGLEGTANNITASGAALFHSKQHDGNQFEYTAAAPRYEHECACACVCVYRGRPACMERPRGRVHLKLMTVPVGCLGAQHDSARFNPPKSRLSYNSLIRQPLDSLSGTMRPFSDFVPNNDNVLDQ